MSQLFENFIEQRENPVKEATTAQSMSVWYQSMHCCLVCCLYGISPCTVAQYVACMVLVHALLLSMLPVWYQFSHALLLSMLPVWYQFSPCTVAQYVACMVLVQSCTVAQYVACMVLVQSMHCCMLHCVIFIAGHFEQQLPVLKPRCRDIEM